MINEPNKTGVTKNVQSSFASMINIGFAPAGGWVVFDNNMHVMANPVAIPRLSGETPKYCENIIPIVAASRCPKITFFVCAKGLSGKPNTNTAVAPKGAISNNKSLSMILDEANTPIVNAAATPDKIDKNTLFIMGFNQSRQICTLWYTNLSTYSILTVVF